MASESVERLGELGWAVVAQRWPAQVYHVPDSPKGDIVWYARKSYSTQYAEEVVSLNVHEDGDGFLVMSSAESRLSGPYDQREGRCATLEEAQRVVLQVCEREEAARSSA